MKKLALIDDAFLRLENRRQPLHIGVLMMLKPPADAAPDFAYQLADRLRQHTETAPPFNQKLVSKRGLHYWEEDNHFDLNHHFVHLALPKPGRIRELLAMVSRVHSGHLDRSYPLWRMYLIEGLEDGRIAKVIRPRGVLFQTPRHAVDSRGLSRAEPEGTAHLRAKILGFRGFDSSGILILRGGIPRPI